MTPDIRKILEKLYNDSLEDTAYNTHHENGHINYALTQIDLAYRSRLCDKCKEKLDEKM